MDASRQRLMIWARRAAFAAVIVVCGALALAGERMTWWSFAVVFAAVGVIAYTFG